MTELPQWAVEEADALAAVAMETLLSMSDKTVEDRGIWLAGIIARALDKAAKPGWQPIETAPRDGTRLLAWCGEGGLRMIYWGYAHNANFHKGGNTWVDMIGPTPYADHLQLQHVPTHWMPLPAAPEGE